MRRCRGLALASCFAALVLSGRARVPAAELQVVSNDEFHLTTIADGVYAIRHKRAAEIGALSGNTTVVVGEKAVLVVDACSAPSIARRDLAQIRTWTDKPIRYLVNTHWHGDHTRGNQAYFEELPGISVIAHAETARQMKGYLAGFLPKNLTLADRVRQMLETGISDFGQEISAEEKEELRGNLPHFEERQKEFATIVVSPPNLTFEGSLELDLGGRVVRLLHLGRGNTAGDIVVHLPEERVVVTGDLLVYPNPFVLGGFPREWAETLGALARLSPEVIVPGHGAVQNREAGLAYLEKVRDLLATVANAVQEETYRVGNGLPSSEGEIEAAVRARPDIAALRTRLVAEDPEKGPWFDRNFDALLNSAYREAWGN